MAWFKRQKKGIVTSTEHKKETPDGVWNKCPNCKKALYSTELSEHNHVCHYCGQHLRIGSKEYFQIIFDGGECELLFENLRSADPLEFVDTKSYPDRLRDAYAKSDLTDAIRVAHGKLEEKGLVIACMDFDFVGGSMGSVVGERISRAVDYCIANKLPLVIISKSGGARMMEAPLSLMQMAKTSAKLALLAEAKLPFVSYMTDPTTGGVTASFAMLGDINVAEPKALIGFAGPRIVKETTGKDLPKGFQTAEFILEHGFLDFIIDRRQVREELSKALKWFAE